MKRKQFIGMTSFGAAAFATSLYFPKPAQDRKLKLGLIGSGWYGMVDAIAALKAGGVEISAVCDVDSEHLSSSAAELEKLQGVRPQTFKYYPELLNMKDLDAVIIGTIPHWHALQFIDACRKGLHIYCEKPLAYDVKEGLAMVRAASDAGNIVQVGFQRRAALSYKKASELIETGRIGDLHQVEARIHYNPGPQDTRIQDPPPSLDWEEWCGPAPRLDYRPSIGHKSWRLEKEYGNGHLVDWGIHHIDIIRRMMGEGMPEDIYATGGILALKDQITSPDTLNVKFGFRKAPVFWQHRLWGNGDVTREFNNGIFFYGSKGTIFVDDSKVTVFPAGRDTVKEDIPVPAPLMQENHVENFINAVKKRDKSLISCTPDDAFRSTASVQLAMISLYTGSVVKWDDEKKDVIDNPSASSMLTRKYRGNYIHP